MSCPFCKAKAHQLHVRCCKEMRILLRIDLIVERMPNMHKTLVLLEAIAKRERFRRKA